MKFILILFLTIWLAACSSAEKSEVIPDRFKNFMSTYFNGYDYEYEDISVRGNRNYGRQSALFTIRKTDLSQAEMSNIYQKLADGGWRIVETNSKNYINFCYGDDSSLYILFPLKKNETTVSGSPINYEDMNAWNIFIYKSTTKIAKCNQDEKDFIDFTKL